MTGTNAIYLEEVVFKEISHGFVGWHVPPCVEVDVQNCQPGDQNQSGEFGLITDCDQDHESASNKILEEEI